jgi:hypothetical protein
MKGISPVQGEMPFFWASFSGENLSSLYWDLFHTTPSYFARQYHHVGYNDKDTL